MNSYGLTLDVMHHAVHITQVKRNVKNYPQRKWEVKHIKGRYNAVSVLHFPPANDSEIQLGRLKYKIYEGLKRYTYYELLKWWYGLNDMSIHSSRFSFVIALVSLTTQRADNQMKIIWLCICQSGQLQRLAVTVIYNVSKVVAHE